MSNNKKKGLDKAKEVAGKVKETYNKLSDEQKEEVMDFAKSVTKTIKEKKSTGKVSKSTLNDLLNKGLFLAAVAVALFTGPSGSEVDDLSARIDSAKTDLQIVRDIKDSFIITEDEYIDSTNTEIIE